jgi:hypothetical protein
VNLIHRDNIYEISSGPQRLKALLLHWYAKPQRLDMLHSSTSICSTCHGSILSTVGRASRRLQCLSLHLRALYDKSRRRKSVLQRLQRSGRSVSLQLRMAVTTLEQFIRFGTDAGKPSCNAPFSIQATDLVNTAGLERFFRLLQAILSVILSFTTLFNGLLLLLSLVSRHAESATAKGIDALRTRRILLDLRGRFALARRFFRVFRFLENFQASHALYVALSNSRASQALPPHTPEQPALAGQDLPASEHGDKGHNHAHEPVEAAKHHAHSHKKHHHYEVWFEILSRSFNGMYLLLESITLIDAMAIPDHAPLGSQLEARITFEAQRFWFLSLACGIVAGVLKMTKVMKSTPWPRLDHDQESGQDAAQEDAEKPEWRREQERLRRIMKLRKKERKVWNREVRRRLGGLLRRLIADGLDLVLPGSIVGWTPVRPGTVAIAMLGSTLLTAWEVWDRCGRELAVAGRT